LAAPNTIRKRPQ